MSDKNETYKKFKRHDDDRIQDNLHDTSFINVCILQRHAWSYDQKRYQEAYDAVEKIKEQVNGEPSKNLIQKDSIPHLKELFLVISMLGPDGADTFKSFSTLTPEVTENICKIVFTKKNFEQLKIIQSFSKKYEGYNTLSLTTFESIDSFIHELKRLDYFYKTMPSGFITFKNIFPKLNHESDYHKIYQEKKSLLKIIKVGKSLFIEIPSRITEINIKKPKSYSLNLERYCYDIVQTIEAITKKQNDLKILKKQNDLKILKKQNDLKILKKQNDLKILKKQNDSIKNVDSENLGFNDLDRFDSDSFDIFKFAKIPTDTKVIAHLKKKYEPKSKTLSKQPMDYFYIFCGLKVWHLTKSEDAMKNIIQGIKEKEFEKLFEQTLKNYKSAKVKSAVDVFIAWFNHKYSGKEHELDLGTITNNYHRINKRIEKKKLYK